MRNIPFFKSISGGPWLFSLIVVGFLVIGIPQEQPEALAQGAGPKDITILTCGVTITTVEYAIAAVTISSTDLDFRIVPMETPCAAALQKILDHGYTLEPGGSTAASPLDLARDISLAITYTLTRTRTTQEDTSRQ